MKEVLNVGKVGRLIKLKYSDGSSPQYAVDLEDPNGVTIIAKSYTGAFAIFQAIEKFGKEVWCDRDF